MVGITNGLADAFEEILKIDFPYQNLQNRNFLSLPV